MNNIVFSYDGSILGIEQSYGIYLSDYDYWLDTPISSGHALRVQVDNVVTETQLFRESRGFEPTYHTRGDEEWSVPIASDGTYGLTFTYIPDAYPWPGEPSQYNIGIAIHAATGQTFNSLSMGNLFWGSDFSDRAVGRSVVDQLFGLGGDDQLVGLGGNDILDGGTGADRMTGGTGDDTYWIDNAGDAAVESAAGGADVVNSSVSYALQAQIEDLTLLGTANLNGTGNDLDNRIYGNAGNNVLSGMGGNDLLEGGDGDDTLTGGDGSDYLSGGRGNDSFRWSAGADWYIGSVGTDLLNFSATSGATIFLAGGGTNAGAAADQQSSSIDNYIGSLTGVDFIQGGNEDNVFWGYGGNDTLIGAGGVDTLLGGDGNDRLSGGGGADIMRGEAGADTFVFDVALASAGRDRIFDFQAGVDTLEIDASVFGGGLVAGFPVDLVANSNPTSAGHAGGSFLYDTDTGMLSFDANGAAAGAAVTFAWLQSAPNLTANDFQLVA